MEYNRIVAVTGISGLFEVLSSKSDGALVRSLEDKSTRFISSRVHNLSHLESIEVYTVRDNVNLTEIFAAMKSSSEALPNVKDNAALKGYFEKVYPELDFERVYTSDMKKMVKWFEIIQSNNIDFSSASGTEEGSDEDTAAAVTAEAAAPETEAPAEKPARAKKAKAAAPAAEGDAPASEEGEKPKRAPRKKKTEE